MDGEAASDRLAANLFLVDRVGVRLFDISAALGTGVGERCIENFVDRRGIERRPMAVLTMLLAGFATGFSGPLLGGSFGKGSGLSFGGAFDGFESSEEFGDAFFVRGRLLRESSLEIGELPFEFDAARTSRN
jgi:hypothetical protein